LALISCELHPIAPIGGHRRTGPQGQAERWQTADGHADSPTPAGPGAAQAEVVDGAGTMSQIPAAAITIAELEANYSLYCKALRMLVREGKTLAKIQRTVCWGRLESLYQCYPGRYKSPDHLYFSIRRDLAASQADWAG
jgi:hypothetical protein